MIERRIENFGAEKFFIAVFLFFGVTNCFMRPPYQLMDEINHFARAWQISEGIFLSPTTTIGEFVNGAAFHSKKIFNLNSAPPDALNDKIFFAEVPVSFLINASTVDADDKRRIHPFSIEDIKKFLKTPLNIEECEPSLIPNTGVYPPLAYFPQVVAALIGRNLNLNAGIIFYMMNLSGLLFVAACIFGAMKFLPETKPLIFVVAMMPMFLIEAASTSIDAVTYGVCFLGTAWLLSLRTKTEKFSRAEIFGLILLSIMLCVKSIYGTILLLYFLIPNSRAGSLKKFLLLGAAILSLNLSASLIWMKIFVEPAGVELYTNYYLGFTETNAAAQKIFVMEHPSAFLAALRNSLIELCDWYWISFVGAWGFLWNVMLPKVFYVLYGIILAFFALSNELRLKLFERGVLLFAAFLSAIAFFLINYLIWSSVGGRLLEGVQGRYFIPITPIILFALSTLPPLRHKNLIALAAGIFSGVMTLLTNFSAFY